MAAVIRPPDHPSVAGTIQGGIRLTRVSGFPVCISTMRWSRTKIEPSRSTNAGTSHAPTGSPGLGDTSCRPGRARTHTDMQGMPMFECRPAAWAGVRTDLRNGQDGRTGKCMQDSRADVR